jgi:hypothetical protein
MNILNFALPMCGLDDNSDYFDALMEWVKPHKPDGGPLWLDIPGELLDGKALTDALLMLTPEQFASDIRHAQLIAVSARLEP